jgi:hypothetical protein
VSYISNERGKQIKLHDLMVASKVVKPCYGTLLSGPIAQMNNACNKIVGQISLLFILYNEKDASPGGSGNV